MLPFDHLSDKSSCKEVHSVIRAMVLLSSVLM